MGVWKTLASIALVGFASASCTTLEHGSITEKVSASEAQINLGSDDGIKTGDRVSVYTTECSEAATERAEDCHEVRTGGGTVLGVSGPHQAIIKVDRNVALDQNVIVRREPRLAH